MAIPKEQTSSLQEGFTTGSAATAAAMAAFIVALNTLKQECVEPCFHHLLQKSAHELLTTPLLIPLPKNATPCSTSNPYVYSKNSSFLCIPVHKTQIFYTQPTLQTGEPHRQNSLWHSMAEVIKDAGDDPDATHKAHIVARARLNLEKKNIHISGGDGVGIVTLPGLGLEIGMPAINPAPRRQIESALESISQKYGYSGGIDIEISVPDGKKIALKTFNSRLGIMDGISILGTQGTVKPFSHSAFKKSITQGIQVAKACACNVLCLSTGRRSERLLQQKYPHLPAQSFVQVADFVEFSLNQGAVNNFTQIYWTCFFGKLVKIAQGHGYTHAQNAELNFHDLMLWCQDHGLYIPSIAKCISANHALELILAHDNTMQSQRVLHFIAHKAQEQLSLLAQQKVKLHLFHLDGRELICLP